MGQPIPRYPLCSAYRLDAAFHVVRIDGTRTRAFCFLQTRLADHSAFLTFLSIRIERNPRLTPKEIRAILPSSAPAGDGQLVVTADGQSSQQKSFRIAKSAFGIFTLNQAGSGPAQARILRSDVTSRLLIKDYLLNDVAIQTRLTDNFAAHGITSDRISLIGSTSREEHLAAYRRIDICLDPFPHGGGVSTWISDETWRPLPRREFSVRKDYDVLVGTNRHTITAQGWVQENGDGFVLP